LRSPEFQILARRVPEVKYFHRAFVFADLVVNQNGTVKKFAHSLSFSDWATHVGKAAQQFHMIQQRTTEAGCSNWVIFGDPTDDLGQIV
jgi:hypothetical protein